MHFVALGPAVPEPHRLCAGAIGCAAAQATKATERGTSSLETKRRAESTPITPTGHQVYVPVGVALASGNRRQRRKSVSSSQAMVGKGRRRRSSGGTAQLEAKAWRASEKLRAATRALEALRTYRAQELQTFGEVERDHELQQCTDKLRRMARKLGEANQNIDEHRVAGGV